MSLVSGDGLSAADVAAVMGNNGGYNNGFNNDDLWIVIFLIAMMNGNWGNGAWGGNPGGVGTQYVVSDVQRGFDNAALMSAIQSLTASTANNFADAEVANCNRQMTLLQALNNGQITTMQGMNNIVQSLDNCCCENRLATADLKYTIATEACADRQAVNDALRDLQTLDTANTQMIINTLNQGFQGVQDKFCQLQLDAKDDKISELQNIINLRAITDAQNNAVSTLRADNAAQTAILEDYLNPVPRPAFVVPNPNCCGNTVLGGCCGN